MLSSGFVSETISQQIPRGRFLSGASFEVKLEKKFFTTNSNEKDNNKIITDRTCYEVFTKFSNVLQLSFDQVQLENIKFAVQNVKKWYFGELDDEFTKKTTDNSESFSCNDQETVSDAPFVATFEIPAINIELRNCLAESEGQPFVLCQGESMLLKYVKEKAHISYIEVRNRER